MTTQLTEARAGTLTDAMRQIAEIEGVSPELVREQTAAGRLVIPANRTHLADNLKPIGIGRVLRTKVNANIGTSSVRSSVQAEIEKMQVAIRVGADAIMDLSTGGDLDAVREELLAHCPAPFGTVPIYQMIQGRNVEDVDADIILGTVRKQAEQGVDFFTIHAGVLREHLPLLEKRVAGIVSRGGPCSRSGCSTTTGRTRCTRCSTICATSWPSTTCASRSVTACGPAPSPTPPIGPSLRSFARWAS